MDDARSVGVVDTCEGIEEIVGIVDVIRTSGIAVRESEGGSDTEGSKDSVGVMDGFDEGDKLNESDSVGVPDGFILTLGATVSDCDSMGVAVG